MSEKEVMSVVLSRENERVHFIGEDEFGHVVHIDGSPVIGGQDKGFRPMQLLLYALGSCAVFDFVSVLYKQSIEIEDVLVEVKGIREQEGGAKPFKSIDIIFIVIGNKEYLETHKTMLSSLASNCVYKLCSVKASLQENIEITFQLDIKNNT